MGWAVAPELSPRAGRYLLAAEAFREAHSLMADAGHPRAGMIFFNIGSSLEEIPGRERDARDAYQRFLTEAPGGEPAVQRQIATVQDRIRELNARIASHGVPVEGTEEATSMSPVAPVVTGVGAAMLIAGAITGGLALDVEGDLSDVCGTARNCPPSARSRVDELRTLTIATDVLLFGGVGSYCSVTVETFNSSDCAGSIASRVIRSDAGGVCLGETCGGGGCASTELVSVWVGSISTTDGSCEPSTISVTGDVVTDEAHTICCTRNL